jgi:hypothetical protein
LSDVQANSSTVIEAMFRVGAASHGPGLMEPKYRIVWLEFAAFRYRAPFLRSSAH